MLKPHLHIKLFGMKGSSFLFFGVLGYITGTALGVLLSIQLQLEPIIVLMMSGMGAGVFFGLAFLAKWIAGKETIVYYHHEISILVLCTLTLFALRIPVLSYLDITLLGIGTFLAFGRIGCYSVGCCHGRPFHHGVQYGQQHVDAGFTWYYKDVPLLPVQLIESIYVFIIVATGAFLLLGGAAPGTVIVLYTVIYGLMRFSLEFLRGDAERPLLIGISEAQWTTLVLTGVTLVMSLVGWLPFYQWHIWVLMIMGAAIALVVFVYRKNERYVLFSPPHVQQVAEGLSKVETFNEATSGLHNKMVNMCATREGLCLSCGTYQREDVRIDHYTLSTNKNIIINTESAKKMAKLIGQLKQHTGKIDLIDKKNGVYHILFTE